MASPAQALVLDPSRRSRETAAFEARLRSRIVGQDRAVEEMVRMYQVYRAGLHQTGRPIETLLFLGPTGTGKTRVAEAAAEILFGEARALVKVDCAEFQHSHEIAKLIGSPPGYLGHQETPALLTQESLDRCHTSDLRLTVLLFDEIEKASDALWHLLLGVLDKGMLTLGDNRRVDFSRTVIIMTSNLGAAEMSRTAGSGPGFAPRISDSGTRNDKNGRIALQAARKKFSPEFMNRIDRMVVFRTLTRGDLDRVVELELAEVRRRICRAHPMRQFLLECGDPVRRFLVDETDIEYGARDLKRAIERHLIAPLSNLLTTGQIQFGDRVEVDVADGTLRFTASSSIPADSWTAGAAGPRPGPPA